MKTLRLHYVGFNIIHTARVSHHASISELIPSTHGGRVHMNYEVIHHCGGFTSVQCTCTMLQWLPCHNYVYREVLNRERSMPQLYFYYN